MDKQILKTVVTVEFAADEIGVAANALALIAAVRSGEEPANICRSEEPTRARRSRKAVDEDTKPKRERKASESEPEDEPNETNDNKDARPKPVSRERSTGITHDDIRDLMAEVLDANEDTKPAILKQLNKIGAKSVGTIQDDDIADFFEFLQSLKSA